MSYEEKIIPPANFNPGIARIPMSDEKQILSQEFECAYLRLRMLTELAAFKMMLPELSKECDRLVDALNELSTVDFLTRHRDTERYL